MGIFMIHLLEHRHDRFGLFDFRDECVFRDFIKTKKTQENNHQRTKRKHEMLFVMVAV